MADLSESSDPLDTFLALLNATQRLDGLYLGSVYTPYLRASAESASTLKALIATQIEKLKGLDQPLASNDLVAIKVKSRQCLEVLSSELGIVPIFLVSPKEGYDVSLLTEQGNRLFPASIEAKVPESGRDMIEVGKALVFEMPTAAGFHLFRVLEAVLKKYWDHVSSGAPRPNLEAIGSYSAELKSKRFGEAKVWETLSQIAKLHRNPVIHPEVMLSTEEAIETMGIVRSVVGAMLRAIPEPPLTTA